MAVEHTVSGFLPGTLVGLYHATQEPRRAAREAPTAVPIALAVAAESTAVTFVDPPTGVALLAYGSRTEAGRAGSRRAPRARCRASLRLPNRRASRSRRHLSRRDLSRRDLRPKPEFGRPQPPPTPRKPTWHRRRPRRRSREAAMTKRPQEAPDA